MSKNLLRFLKENSHWWLIVLGSSIWSLTMVKSGLTYSYGVGFWGPNGHDGIWHLSLIESLARGSWEMPVFAGELIRNYHIGFDLLLALVHRLTYIPVSVLYFQVIPPLLAAGIGIYAWKFMLSWTKSRSAAMWGLFFVYFGGSFGWLVNLVRGAGLGGESMFWAQQSISTLVNPPFALSLLIIFYVLFRLSVKSSITNNKSLVLLSVLIGCLALVKIYAAILFLPGLALAALRDRRLFKLLIWSSLFSLLFYLPFNRLASSLIVFRPFWFIENMLALSDRFFWPRLYEAMIVYKTTRNLIKFIPSYSLAILIFLTGNLGVRILGLAKIRGLKKPDSINIILWVIAILGFIFPLLFIQRGTPWNPIQFFYYSQFILGLFAAIIISKLNVRYGLLVILLTIPTTVNTLGHYLPARPPAMISREELSALRFLSAQPPGVVFTPPVYPDLYYPAPRPLYKYESTAYVSAYSGHPVFLEDTVNLSITQYPYQDRFSRSVDFMSAADLSSAKEFITANKIRYLYLPEVASVRPAFSAQALGGSVIFENSRVSVWKVAVD